MDSLKKKMLAMKMEKENALEKAVQLEKTLEEKGEELEKKDETLAELQSRMKTMQSEADEVTDGLLEATTKLEETEKRATNAEADVAAMKRRIMLIEEDLEQSTSRLTETTTKLEEASGLAESSERQQKEMLNKELGYSTELKELEDKLQICLRDIETNETSYAEITARIEVLNAQYESKVKLFESQEQEISNLENHLNSMATKMKTLQAEQEKLNEQETVYEARIRQLRAQLLDTENRVKMQEAETQRRTAEIKNMHDILQNERAGYADLKKKLDSMVAEL